MIDVSPKFNTLRYARAEGKVFAKPETIRMVGEKKIPKGDVCEVARAAGILAAKRTPDWIVFCHVIPIDWAEVSVSAEEDYLLISAEVRSVWKTGVEMEALSAVAAACLNAYDMMKPVDKSLSFGEIRVVEKKGGKSDYMDSFEKPIRSAVLVISDSTYAGTRKDKSGKIISEFLKSKQVDVAVYDILPDVPEQIKSRIVELADKEKIDLIITTGGTGLGPKDYTPETTAEIIDKDAPGIVEAIRKHGKDRTPFAMLSRELAGVRGKTLIINLPGSSRGAKESMEALFPGILHAFPMLWGGGH